MLLKLREDEIRRAQGYVYLKKIIQIAYAYHLGYEIHLPEIRMSEDGWTVDKSHHRTLAQLLLFNTVEFQVSDESYSIKTFPFNTIKINTNPNLYGRDGRFILPYIIPDDFSKRIESELKARNYPHFWYQR